jgi:Linear amide C-N hydrolases, choloylglycine hydrolase family
MPYAAADAGKTIAQWELGSWILENFASVAEVKANIGNIVVASTVFEGWGFAPEAHYIVHDASGKSIVIEYVGGKLNVYDNPLGVFSTFQRARLANTRRMRTAISWSIIPSGPLPPILRQSTTISALMRTARSE